MTVPTKAIEAAEAACPDEHISLGHWEPRLTRAEMLKVLEAAAPHIIEAEHERIRKGSEYWQGGIAGPAWYSVRADLLDADA